MAGFRGSAVTTLGGDAHRPRSVGEVVCAHCGGSPWHSQEFSDAPS
jgi:hypothetical protein